MPRRPLLTLAILAACSSDLEDTNGDGVADGVFTPNNVTVVSPARPKGHVAGDVVDATTGRPLQGVAVAIFGGSIAGQVTTDATGTFQFGPIAAGARFALRFTANGYTRAAIGQLTIEDDAGNFPTENGALYVGPIGLIPTRGSFAVQVVSESGRPVSGAKVIVETAVSFFDGQTARGTAFATGMSDTDGHAAVTGLPDVWSLPPRLANHAGLVVHVAPVDVDGDMRPDLRGESITIAGADVREGTIPPIVVLEAGGADQTFRVIASNIPGLAGAPADAPPPVLGAMDPIQIVFSLPADEDTFLVDFKNEDGTGEVAARIVPGVLGNVFLITHDAPLATGQEYNVSIRVQTSATNPGQTLQRSASFFVRGDPATPVRARGNFVDGGRDSLWGSGNDRLELTLDVPVGRAGQNPAFVAQLFVELDLDGSLAIGDGRGELPQLGSAYPTPILVSAREPSPGNGAPSTGFTRFFAPVAIDLVSPLTQLQGPVAFEIRIDKADNGSVFVTDAEGRPAPAKIEGTAQLISP